MGNAVEIKEAGNLQAATLADVHDTALLAHENTAPLSFAQQQIWLHAQLVPDIPIYNEPVTIHRRGALSVPVLERVLAEIVRRHQAWRTKFVFANGEPVQVVLPAGPVHLRTVDLRQLPASQREAQAKKLAVEESIRPFNLSEGPLFRTLLVHLSDTEHRLFLTLHHIIFDGYSIYRVLLPEVATLYEAFSHGQAPPLTELAVQYPEFASWERDWLLRGGNLSTQLSYWRKQLGGDLPVLQLPSDRPRPAMQSFRGAIQPVVIPKDLSEALKKISRREGATLFMGLVSAFAVLLHRYSSAEDITIGTVSSGRKRSELEGLLGYFLNPVVLRNNLSGNPTFRELLRRTREVTLDALSNDDAPFTHVVHEVHPNRSLSCNPLFQVLLTLEPPFAETQDNWTVALTQSEVDTGFSKLDLCLELDDRPVGLIGRFKYNTDLFDPETVARMAGHLTTLLESIVADPDKRISHFPILTAPERRQLQTEWNDTAAGSPSDLCIHELVMNQAERTPDAVALVDGTRELTYRDLRDRSSQLAASLQKAGIVPEMPVGLYFESGWEMAVAMLAVLQAGGACVPLDPSYPAERHAHVFADAQLKLLLTQERLRSRLPLHHAAVVCVDSADIDQENPEPSSNNARPDHLAFVIYTSGSTGKPKGVQITHRNLVHSTQARSVYYGAAAGRFLLLSSFAFDSSLAGIFSTLSQGGALVLTPGPVQSNLTQLSRLVEQNRISHLLCVPSLYSLLLDQARPGQLDSLQVAIVAGEACPVELVERHYEKLPQATLFNEYGPTEATVWSTVYKCAAGRAGNLVPIGRPIPNARVYVLDSNLNQVPVGVPGELYVGGPGVARGYLNRPDETNERFIPDVYSQEPDARLYKTGDRVRHLPDGNLELLGRLDHQVKIRGFRIELEEIEAVIAEFKGVRQAAVTMREAGPGESSLLAYVASGNPSQFDVESLRHFLNAKLPEAMVPAGFVVLESLPLMPNGKIDRNALPVPSRPESGKQLLEAHSELETRLLQIWQDVLGKQGFGVTENFFDLGGHSLLVAKLLLRIEQQFGRRLALANIFQAPTVRQLAPMLHDQKLSGHHPAVVPVQPRGSRPILFWVRGGSFLFPLSKRLGSDQPVLALHLPAEKASKLPVPYQLGDIAGALVSSLREVQPKGPYHLAGLCVNGVIAYEMARQLNLQGEQVALLALFDAQNPAYYEDFSQESHVQLLMKRAEYQLANLRRQKLSGFIGERLIGIRRRASVRYWRIHHALGLSVTPEHLQDLDTIVHPASFVYRPGAYPGPVAFFQSTDWPDGQYWEFHASWHGLIDGMKVYRIPGGHESMFHEENVDLLARNLQNCLSDATEKRSGAA